MRDRRKTSRASYRVRAAVTLADRLERRQRPGPHAVPDVVRLDLVRVPVRASHGPDGELAEPVSRTRAPVGSRQDQAANAAMSARWRPIRGTGAGRDLGPVPCCRTASRRGPLAAAAATRRASVSSSGRRTMR